MASTRSSDQILSPDGEGYCRHCRFVVGLDASGLMDDHIRGLVFNKGPWDTFERCAGSGRRPAKRTPVTSRLSVFTSRAKLARCPVCARKVPVTRSKVFKQHSMWAIDSVINTCDGSWRYAG